MFYVTTVESLVVFGKGVIVNLGNETEQVEFKKTTSEIKEGICSIAAILNKHQSGILYFSVDAKGTVVGQDVSEKTLRDISQTVSNKIEPKINPSIEQVEANGKWYIKVTFDGVQ